MKVRSPQEHQDSPEPWLLFKCLRAFQKVQRDKALQAIETYDGLFPNIKLCPNPNYRVANQEQLTVLGKSR